MKFFPNMTDASVEPITWATDREAEGWPGVRVSDHLWITKPFPHLWVTLAQMAMCTSTLELGSSFANNLFRSPVEFVQASLSMQRASGGRFEAGLGAGWTEEEMIRTGRSYPDGPTRAGMYFEAATIVKELFANGTCSFHGEHYDVDVPMIGPACPAPPLLAVSVGGPRTIREVAPLADIVELKANGAATRGGKLDLAAVGSVSRDDLRRLVERVRAVNDHAPLGLFAMVAAGHSDAIRARKEALGDGLFGGFTGDPSSVADSLLSLEDLGITRVQLTEFVPGTILQLAPLLAHLR